MTQIIGMGPPEQKSAADYAYAVLTGMQVPKVGDVWFNSETSEMYIFVNTEWVLLRKSEKERGGS